ncbi:hypothetical protein K8B33_14145 [Alcanivorax sp. JB21]|uniref:hypothetical protein n=1 Tax=Alcanivorax limicola TaxID=2874102 RepID=UPI001CBB9BA1|nr:hypothetical protein [Alcanivorax limicola]MBZ2190246.1 hypothetical protein [Alcanivorax limicola]
MGSRHFKLAFHALWISVALVPDAVALSCAGPVPHISTVAEIDERGVPTFTDQEYFGIDHWRDDGGQGLNRSPDRVIVLDRYRDVVKDYMTSERSLIRSVQIDPPTLRHSRFFQNYADRAYDVPDLVPGDILVIGTGNPCMPLPRVVFDGHGNLRYVITAEQYSDYEIDGVRLHVDVAYPVSCGGDACKSRVSFQVDQERFSLKAGESYRPKNRSIASVSVLDASISLYYYTQDPQHFDWLLGHFVNMLVRFSPEDPR